MSAPALGVLWIVPSERHVERWAREGRKVETRARLKGRLFDELVRDRSLATAAEVRLALAEALPPVAAGDPLLAPLARGGQRGSAWERTLDSIDGAIGALRAAMVSDESLARVVEGDPLVVERAPERGHRDVVELAGRDRDLLDAAPREKRAPDSVQDGACLRLRVGRGARLHTRDRARRNRAGETQVAERCLDRDPSRRRVERSSDVLTHDIERPPLARGIDRLLEGRELRARPFPPRPHERRVERAPPRDVPPLPIEHEAGDHPLGTDHRSDARGGMHRDPLGEHRPHPARVHEAARIEHRIDRAACEVQHPRAAPRPTSLLTPHTRERVHGYARRPERADRSVDRVERPFPRLSAIALPARERREERITPGDLGEHLRERQPRFGQRGDRSIPHELVEQTRPEPRPRLDLPPVSPPTLDVALTGDDP